MAKGNAISGNITGKKGSSVFYKVSNSNNKVTQGLREYQPVVTNPKTTSQAQQRMKLQPATNFYRGLSDVLDHSFEGQKYGGRNHSYFMKLAIGNADGINYPFLYKGDTNFVPGSYLVSRGSLGRVKVSDIYRNSGLNYDDAGMNLECYDDASESFAIWVEETVDSEPKLQKGDQITGIFCYRNAAGRYYPVVRRLVLDPAKYEDAAAYQVMSNAGLFIVSTRVSPVKSELDERGVPLPLTSDTMVAAAVILSRPTRSAGGQVTWRRSISRMYLTPEFQAMFQNEQLYRDALASYLKAEVDANSEWYLNQGAIMQGAIDAVPAGATMQVYNTSTIPLSKIYEGGGGNRNSMTLVKVDGYIPLTVVGYVSSDEQGVSPSAASSIKLRFQGYDNSDETFEPTGAIVGPIQADADHPALPASRVLVNFMDYQKANQLKAKLGFTGRATEWEGTNFPE